QRMQPDDTEKILTSIPGISTQMVADVERQLDEQGWSALVLGPTRGMPYKIYSRTLAHGHESFREFMLLSVPARMMRFLAVTAGVAGLGKLSDRMGASKFEKSSVFLAGWGAFYTLYFTKGPGQTYASSVCCAFTCLLARRRLVPMTEFSFPEWSGRDDGPGHEHARWHSTVAPVDNNKPGFTLLGFVSDAGVRRNQGRPGAAQGPAAIRSALGSMAVHHDIALFDGGDAVVVDDELEATQQRYGQALTQLLRQRKLTVGLGGGHEITWASYLGVRGAFPDARLVIINFDALINNRPSDQATSGTGFAQIIAAEAQKNRQANIMTLGIAEAANTTLLFECARQSRLQCTTDDRWITNPSEVGSAVA